MAKPVITKVKVEIKAHTKSGVSLTKCNKGVKWPANVDPAAIGEQTEVPSDWMAPAPKPDAVESAKAAAAPSAAE